MNSESCISLLVHFLY